MAKTPSKMIPLGSQMKEFELLDPSLGEKLSLKEISTDKKGVLIAFICNHCPFVKHIKATLIALAHKYMKEDIAFIAINSNDIESHPSDSPEKMKEEDYPFPYLFDETQEVAKAYEAACTPDFFLFNEQGALIYRGQMDDSRPGSDIIPSGEDIEEAIKALLEGKEPNAIQKPSIGCNIKWKS